MVPPKSTLTILEALSNDDILLLKYLDSIKQPTGLVPVSYKVICNKFGWSKKKTYRIVSKLIELGLIVRERKGYYKITEKGATVLKLLETKHEVGTHSKPSIAEQSTTSPLILLLSGLLGFEVLERWARQCFLFYRPHNVRIRIGVRTISSSLASKGKIETPYGVVKIIIPNNIEKSPYLLVEVIDYALIRHDNIGAVLTYIASLPYKIASWLEHYYNVIVDYDNIELVHVALGIIINPNEVPEDIVNKLVSWLLYQNIDAKKTMFVVDNSIGYPEIEIETDNVNKLMNVLTLMFPLTLVEFLKRDMQMDEQILANTETIIRLLEEIKQKLDKEK